MKENKLTIKKILGLFAISIPIIALGCSASITGSENDNNILRVYNWEDYIYEQDINEGYEEKDLIEQFEDYIYETEGREITVIYDTFDTNETMLSELETGKSSYDLICPSDYTIQRMIQNDLLEPYDEDFDEKYPNYSTYASEYLLGKLNNIKVTNYNENGEAYIMDVNVNDYAKGYFWGTLGILYNPDSGIDEPEVIREDMKDWNVLWDPKYYNQISIKDSMRDTYAAGIMNAYSDQFIELRDNYQNGSLSLDEYNQQVTTLFNSCDDETLQLVGRSLNYLKSNIFGFEVDSGKEDIQTGKVSVNLAWSGDAVYAMDNAESNDNPIYLEYSIPDTGANIWFDGWVMPKGANKDLAQKFVNFISDPVNAAQNVSYVGYTSFIAGYEVFDTVRCWYDSRYVDEEFDESIDTTGFKVKDLSYFFGDTLIDEEGNEIKPEIYVSPDQLYRQIDTMFPDEDQLAYLAVMDDFPVDQRAAVLEMWEELKATDIPAYIYIILLVFIVLIVAVILYRYIKKKTFEKQKKERRAKLKEANNQKLQN